MHIFCLNASIIVDIGYESYDWYFMTGLFKFLQEKMLKSLLIYIYELQTYFSFKQNPN